MRKLLFLLCFYSTLIADSPAEEVFTNIYENELWGKEGSGAGSTVENAKTYMQFLQRFLKKKQITSVVDVGCGDWQFSQHINWGTIQYTGFDVVQFLITNLNEQFGNSHIRFVHGDGIHLNLPEASLLLCKDVLQHLPYEDIFGLIDQFGKFKYCLITNDINLNNDPVKNIDIERGAFRPLDLTQPPFNLKGKKVLTYRAGGTLKQVLLIQRNSK